MTVNLKQWLYLHTSYITTYEWYRDGAKIKEATRAIYTTTAADAGKKIVCKTITKVVIK